MTRQHKTVVEKAPVNTQHTQTSGTIANPKSPGGLLGGIASAFTWRSAPNPGNHGHNVQNQQVISEKASAAAPAPSQPASAPSKPPRKTASARRKLLAARLSMSPTSDGLFMAEALDHAGL